VSGDDILTTPCCHFALNSMWRLWVRLALEISPGSCVIDFHVYLHWLEAINSMMLGKWVSINYTVCTQRIVSKDNFEDISWLKTLQEHTFCSTSKL
jgi:hypothetical protein